MRCPACNIWDSKVVDCRPKIDQKCFMRRRVCNSCGHKFITHEIVPTDSRPDSVKIKEAREVLSEAMGKLSKVIGGWYGG